MSQGAIIGLSVGISLLVVFIIFILILVPVKTWFVALVSGAHVSMSRLIGMRMRRLKVGEIVAAFIMAKKAGLGITIVDLETHCMAGGNVELVVNSLIAAHSAKFSLTVDQAKAIDLAGRDVYKAVKESVTPKVIQTDWISAVAKDGIELKVKAKVTVKANLEKLIGGAGEETIIARVGEGIVTTVGSSETHQEVLENPDFISKTVLGKGLALGTAFEISSVDIADIDVGRNIGAMLLTDEAEKDKIMAQARAEERRSMAIALEQEMKAKTQEMKAMVLAAEAEVPKAIASAIKDGKFGVMDYYKLQNLNSDTAMRNSIAGDDSNKKGNRN